MIRFLKIATFMSSTLLPFFGFGQYLLPVGMLPINNNSSFVGMANQPRAFANFGYAVGSYDSYNYYTSYDNFFQRIGSGIGISVHHRNNLNFEDGRKYNQTQVSFAIAPKLSLKGKYTISPSVEVSGYTFRQELKNDPDWDDNRYSGIRSRVGILFSSSNYYIGYSINTLYGTDSNIRTIRYRDYQRGQLISHLQIGYSFQKNKSSKFSFTPQLQFSIKSKIESTDQIIYLASYNLGFRYNRVLFGIINYGFHIGWQAKALRVSLINEFGYNDPNRNHETNLVIRYLFFKNEHEKFHAF